MGSITKFCDAMRWAADSNKPGYSQSDRYSLTPDKFFTDELTNTDCSELTVVALQYAGFDTGNAVTTRNMSSELCARGWERLPVGTPLKAGDILLNDADHVAVWLGDCLAQASIGEGGLVSGGARGDQTGWEVNTRDYYDYPWDCILRWTGGDDEHEESEFDMTEALFYCDDNHMGYKKNDVIYWNPSAGFCFLEHPDCIDLIKQCSPGIAEIHTASNAPWLERARLATNPIVAAKTFGKRN